MADLTPSELEFVRKNLPSHVEVDDTGHTLERTETPSVRRFNLSRIFTRVGKFVLFLVGFVAPAVVLCLLVNFRARTYDIFSSPVGAEMLDPEQEGFFREGFSAIGVSGFEFIVFVHKNFVYLTLSCVGMIVFTSVVFVLMQGVSLRRLKKRIERGVKEG